MPKYIVSCSDGVILDFESWCDKMSTDKPHFHFWYLTLLLQLDILTFIRSVREGNFSLYLFSLAKLIPCFFAMNHINYARWLPVHLRDMKLLPILSPSTESKFRDGLFIAPAYSKVRYRGSTFRPFVRSFVRSFVRPSVRPQFMSRCLLCSSDSWEYETLHNNYP